MHYSINLKGNLLEIKKPLVMGIVNLTPDSFYQGQQKDVIQQVETMLADGASFVDIGGQSTRPGATRISKDEELSRVIPTLRELVSHFPDAIFSIDTFYSEVARIAIDNGAAMINDVSAGTLDPDMYETAGKCGVPYILMHMQGNPENMQKAPGYQHVTAEVLTFFLDTIVVLKRHGVKDIIVDPGFGFGKNMDQNFQLLRELGNFTTTGHPVLVGVSRKKMTQVAAGVDANEALNATTAANMIALMNGASILRVHDVKEAVQAVKMFNCIYPN